MRRRSSITGNKALTLEQANITTLDAWNLYRVLHPQARTSHWDFVIYASIVIDTLGSKVVEISFMPHDVTAFKVIQLLLAVIYFVDFVVGARTSFFVESKDELDNSTHYFLETKTGPILTKYIKGAHSNKLGVRDGAISMLSMSTSHLESTFLQVTSR